MRKNQLALLGGKPVGVPKAPRHPEFSRSAIAEVVGLLERGDTVGLGRTHKTIARSEDAISQYHSGQQALLVNSGQAALSACLMGLAVGPGDEVITTPYTWGASISAILLVGATPVFCDVDPLTGLMNPAAIAEKISPRTKAILVVHIFGQPADMPAINAISRQHGLKVIEDGSQAHGATIGGTVVGNFSDAAGFSCMGGKLLATAEAGYMVTPHPEVFWKSCLVSQHYGRSAEADFPQEYKPFVDSLTYTYRVSPLIATLFPSQLKKLPKQIHGRQNNVRVFREALNGCEIVRFPQYPKNVLPAYHFVTVNFIPEKAGIRRDTFSRALKAEGVNAWPYVPGPIHQWARLQWKGYRGPVPHWQAQLRRSKTNYAAQSLPGCEYKVAHALEIPWNYYRPNAAGMKRMAKAFLKVQDNLPALQKWEENEDRKHGVENARGGVVKAAKRAVSGYAR